MNPLRAALLPTLLLLAAIAATPATQAVGVPLVVTTGITTDGSRLVSGINCGTATTGIAVVTGVVGYSVSTAPLGVRIGDAFYDDLGFVAAPYGNGLFMDGVKVPTPAYSLAHTYVLTVAPGPHCFTFKDSYYGDNVGALAIVLL